MPDLVVAAEVRVLVLERVERMWVGRHDPPEPGLRELADVVLGENLEQPFLTGPPNVIAGTPLTLVEDPEVDAGRLEDARDQPGRLLHPNVERGEVPDEPQPVDVLRARIDDRRGQAVRPLRPSPRRLAERVALLGQAGEGGLEARFHDPLVDQRAAHRDDRRDVLDPDRAGLDAGEAGRAGPQRVGTDETTGEESAAARTGADVRGVGTVRGVDLLGPVGPIGALFAKRREDRPFRVGLLAQVEDEIAGGQRCAGCHRGTGHVATATLRARVEIQQLLPGHVREVTEAEMTVGRSGGRRREDRQTAAGQR